MKKKKKKKLHDVKVKNLLLAPLAWRTALPQAALDFLRSSLPVCLPLFEPNQPVTLGNVGFTLLDLTIRHFQDVFSYRFLYIKCFYTQR